MTTIAIPDTMPPTPSAKTSIEALDLYGDGDRTVHYEVDHDLGLNVKAASDGGTCAATLLMELGIDGYEAHAVKIQVGPGVRGPDAFHYEIGDDKTRALTDAIEALTAVRDRLAAIAALDA